MILIINSSYTANLTSILTVQQLAPSINGLESLIQTNLPIGYQTGSFVRDYLINLNVNPRRLKDLESREMYERALNLGPYSQGGVAAIVDELPYVQLLQASNCRKYTIAGQEFTKSGWGFVSCCSFFVIFYTCFFFKIYFICLKVAFSFKVKLYLGCV